MRDSPVMSDIPFSVDRTSSLSLVQQVADGCRNAIATGAFPVGEFLPSLNEMALRTGVSLKVVRSAYERLVREGWLLPRNGIGYQAKDSGAPVWKGTALLVYDNNSYAMCASVAALQRALEVGGYLIDCVKVSKLRKERTHDFERLRARLFKRYDFVFTFVVSDAIVKLFESLDCPVFTASVNARSYPSLVGIPVCETGCYEDVADLCVEKGVRTVEVVDFHKSYCELVKVLQSRGLSVSETLTPFDNREECFFTSIRKGARDMFVKRLSHGRRLLPDLLLFHDDYVLSGALPAFSASGVRVPEEVGIVGFCNRGNEPCWSRELTRLVYDPSHEGEFIAAAVLARLSDRGCRSAVGGALKLVRGETF